jgi:prepilin-type N-terminal cleavage/methylation domain-containing protein
MRVAIMSDLDRVIQRASTKGRNAFSLIEVLVAVAISSLLMGVVVSLMLGLKQWDRVSRATSVRNEQLLRLAGTLRTDIRGGSDVLLSVEGPLVVMTASGEQLRYELGADGCRRTVIAPGGAGPRTDLFAIGKASNWIVERKAPGRRPLVAVTLESPAAKDGTAERRLLPFLVCAAVGADRAERNGS